MSKSTERVRIEVGFDGGQTLVALVDEASADKLEKALADGLDGALSLDSEDGRTVIATRILDRKFPQTRDGYVKGQDAETRRSAELKAV